jgi:uncharacterized surface protein with fasciclin (FAS1) repeats
LARLGVFVVLVTLVAGACSSSAKSAKPPPQVTPTSAGAHSILQTAAYDNQLSTLAVALNVGGLVGTASGKGPFTLFAPTNDAFANMKPRGTFASLLRSAHKAQLARILSYHLVRGRLLVKDMKPGPLATVEGAPLHVAIANGKVTLTDSKGNKATIVRSDVPAANGVIQVVDNILAPPS